MNEAEEIRWSLYFIKYPERLDTIRTCMKVVQQGAEKVEERVREIHDAANTFSEIYVATAIEEKLLLIQKIYNENGGSFE